MNIYSKKQRWKLILMLAAASIVAISLFYTNSLVSKLSKEEQRKAKLWAESIEEKSKFVLYTNNLFDQIEQEERKNGELWAKASKSLITTTDNCNLSFIFEVVRNNETVPVILSDQNLQPISNRNVEKVLHPMGLNTDRDSLKIIYRSGSDTIFRLVPFSENTMDSINAINSKILESEIRAMQKLNAPIEIQIVGNRKNYLFYRDSYIFAQLKTARDDLIQSFTNDIIKNSANVPVIYADSATGKILDFGNLEPGIEKDSIALQQKFEELMEHNEPIRVRLSSDDVRLVYYEESFLLTQLRYYPYIQFFIIGVFLLIAYLMFSTARKAEQNQVWVGMAKETAHQLGTPLSSLMAWLEMLKMQAADENTLNEISKDIKRLETITERFSKIGSVPDLKESNLFEVLENTVDYLRRRVSNKTDLRIEGDYSVTAKLNIPLFEWVIENITKNAVDAMSGSGVVTYTISNQGSKVYLDINDTGKGMTKATFKRIFKPGFTSKKRGWGLGLTLVKRIVENYHSGQIFVLKSELNKGTVFRIVLHTSGSRDNV